MARYVKRITINRDGRDHKKVFELTEFPVLKSERWAMKAILGMMNAGVEIPPEMESLGLTALLSMGLGALGKLPSEIATPLFDEMLECVKIAPDKSDPSVVRSLIESDIEELSTILFLRKEIIKLHISSFMSASQ